MNPASRLANPSEPPPKVPQIRDRRTKRYSYEGQWERLCVCGHPLGHHGGEPPHACFESDFGTDCDCEKFRPSKKKNPEAAGAREAKRGLQEIGKQREQAFRDREREKLEHLRRKVAELQARKRDAMHAIVRQCKAARAELPARVRAIRSAAKVEGAELRQATANRCQFRKVKTRAAAGAALGRARAELRQERRDQRLIRRAGKKPPARVRAHEARAESDSAVEANIPAELVPIWRRVKGQIRAGAGVSRTEAFLRWVEENPGEVWAMREAQAEAELRRLVAEERKASRARPRTWATRGEVPF